MRTALLVLLLLLVACQPAVEIVQDHQADNPAPQDNQVVADDVKPVVPPANPSLPDPCAPPSNLVSFAEKNDSAIGVQSLTLIDKGGWYKITSAKVYLKIDHPYLNDFRIDLRPEHSKLMNFNTQKVNLPENTTCGVYDIPLNLNVQDISIPYEVMVQLGVGQNRMGTLLVSASTSMDLQAYVK